MLFLVENPAVQNFFSDLTVGQDPGLSLGRPDPQMAQMANFCPNRFWADGPNFVRTGPSRRCRFRVKIINFCPNRDLASQGINRGGVYRIPQEFRAMITTKSFNSAISKAAVNARSDMKRKMANMWHTKSNIYELVKALACKSSQEMTDPIWARFTWVQMKLVDYKAKPGPAANGQDGFWDYIDKQLAERRETSLTIPVTNRAAYSSYPCSSILQYTYGGGRNFVTSFSPDLVIVTTP
ncbi:hypothetical protein B0H10DRAFT_1953923 [Mycena sp. CBHHK59/15]|nr:hypothetical protein B0H10DRAFT_1953923 [Mycena sp. CBHHK59/15]